MRITLIILIAGFLISSCNKDGFTSAPQITFKSLSPNVWQYPNLDPTQGPLLSLQLRDAEGDFGRQDTSVSYVYVKNITIPPFETDSFPFPDLTGINRTNMDVQVDVVLNNIRNSGNPTRPYTDTIFFEVYVQDFAKNKSNVIKTPDPLYLVTQ